MVGDDVTTKQKRVSPRYSERVPRLWTCQRCGLILTKDSPIHGYADCPKVGRDSGSQRVKQAPGLVSSPLPPEAAAEPAARTISIGGPFKLFVCQECLTQGPAGPRGHHCWEVCQRNKRIRNLEAALERFVQQTVVLKKTKARVAELLDELKERPQRYVGRGEESWREIYEYAPYEPREREGRSAKRIR